MKHINFILHRVIRFKKNTDYILIILQLIALVSPAFASGRETTTAFISDRETTTAFASDRETITEQEYITEKAREITDRIHFDEGSSQLKPESVSHSDAKLGQFPFTVAILYSNYAIKCTGVLLTSFHVLTAARCVVIDETDKNGAQAKFIMAGDVERFETLNGYQELKDIDMYIPHPNYIIYHDLQYDIGLLKTKLEFKQNALVHPLNFGGFSPPDIWRDHTMTTVSWGRMTKGGTCSTRLHFTHVKFVDKESCDVQDSDEFFCAESTLECPGAAGSPLVIENEVHGLFLESRSIEQLRINVSIFLRINLQKYWVFQALTYYKHTTSALRSLRRPTSMTGASRKMKFSWIIFLIYPCFVFVQKFAVVILF